MLTVFRVLLHGGPCPRETATGCRTSGLFGQNVHQRLGELTIKRRNVRAFTHRLSTVIPRVIRNAASRLAVLECYTSYVPMPMTTFPNIHSPPGATGCNDSK